MRTLSLLVALAASLAVACSDDSSSTTTVSDASTGVDSPTTSPDAAAPDAVSSSTVARDQAVGDLVKTFCARVFECAAGSPVMSDGLCDGGGTFGKMLPDQAACETYMNGTDCVIDLTDAVAGAGAYDGEAFARCLLDVTALACESVDSDGVWEEGGVMSTSPDCSSAITP